MISTSGIITTIAGTGNPGHSGDGGSPMAANIGSAGSVSVNPSGTVLLIGEVDLAFMRKVTLPVGVDEPAGQMEIAVYPNPSNGKLWVEITGADDQDASVVIHDIAGREILTALLPSSQRTEIDLGEAGKGVYIMSITMGSAVMQKRIVVQ
jgi:hypothetical protein